MRCLNWRFFFRIKILLFQIHKSIENLFQFRSVQSGCHEGFKCINRNQSCTINLLTRKNCQFCRFKNHNNHSWSISFHFLRNYQFSNGKCLYNFTYLSTKMWMSQWNKITNSYFLLLFYYYYYYYYYHCYYYHH